ncbi:MAG: hypothetical protein J6Z02_01125 [Lachnospiraceae bacterium]|nr:hypothetical protein [Lachnospiraceae bacterium]
MNKRLSIVLSIALCISLVANVFAVKMAKAENNDEKETKEETVVTSENVADEMTYIISDGNGSGIKALDCDSNEVSLDKVPVSVNVKYFLDEKEVNANDLKGKSGHVKISYEFTNLCKTEETISGKTEEIYVPYACITSLMLDDKNASNVTVSTGKVIDDGNRSIVVGLAFPGMQENIGTDTDKIDIPDGVDVEFDAKDLEDITCYIVASSNFLNDVDLKDVNAKDLEKDMDEVKDAMDKLIDGAVKLTEGFDEFDAGLKKYTDGVESLSSGLNTICANNDKLNNGAGQIFDSILDTANATLKQSGLDVPTLTKENYAKVLDGAASKLDVNSVEKMARSKVEAGVREKEDLIKAKVTAAVKEQVKAGVAAAMQGADEETINKYTESKMATDEVKQMINEKCEEQIKALIDENLKSDEVKKSIAEGKAKMEAGASSLKDLKAKLDSVNNFYNGVKSYTSGVKQAATGAATLKDSSKDLLGGDGKLKDGAVKLKDGLKEFDKKAIEKLVSLVDDDLAGYADRINAIKDAATGNEDKNNYVFKIN